MSDDPFIDEPVGRVSADLVVSSKRLSPREITDVMGLRPNYTHELGAAIYDSSGRRVGQRTSNYWTYGVAERPTSNDLDEHIRSLLEVLKPRAAAIRDLMDRGAGPTDVFIWTLWESSRLLFGAGPIISAATAQLIGALGVELHFDIYCLLEHDV